MKRRLSALLCALTLALSLSGCWSGDVSDDSSGDFWEETPPVEADTSSTLTPITSFALPYLQGVTLDPITCPDGMQQTLGALLYEGLLVLDESFAPQNVLCSRYEHNDDCTSYTFYLRDGVSFSDGSSLTASDVLATLRRAQESERYSARFANVVSMRASNGAQRKISVRTRSVKIGLILERTCHRTKRKNLIVLIFIAHNKHAFFIMIPVSAYFIQIALSHKRRFCKQPSALLLFILHKALQQLYDPGPFGQQNRKSLTDHITGSKQLQLAAQFIMIALFRLF